MAYGIEDSPFLMGDMGGQDPMPQMPSTSILDTIKQYMLAGGNNGVPFAAGGADEMSPTPAAQPAGVVPSPTAGAELSGFPGMPAPNMAGVTTGPQDPRAGITTGPQLPQTAGVPLPTAAPGQPGAAGQNSFLNALKGVVAPPRPDVVKPTSPHLVGPKGTIQGGHLVQLLEALNAQNTGGLKLPPTLGAALGRG